jgi:RimJ/RimL family protein N-acetyltransferase
LLRQRLGRETGPVRSIEDIWPLFGLRVSSGPLELRAIRDADIPALVDLAERGIHDPDAMPFSFPWSTAPAAELGRNMATFYWRNRAEFSASAWSLELLVRWQGRIAGCQGYATRNFLVTRTGETGSWLGSEFQGQGIGTLMRQTVCAFVFDHLDAQEVTSAAFLDNPASLAVSRKVGYAANGRTREKRRDGELAISQRLVLRPKDLRGPPHGIHVEGVPAVRRLIGLDT